jgi:hypothetical protein
MNSGEKRLMNNGKSCSSIKAKDNLMAVFIFISIGLWFLKFKKKNEISHLMFLFQSILFASRAFIWAVSLSL